MSLVGTLARSAALAALASLPASLWAQPVIVGHRGTGSNTSSNRFPENTVVSIEQAFAEGADLVEIDVQLAKGGVPVLWHDKTVEVDGQSYRTDELELDQYPPIVGGDGMVAPVPSFREALRAALDLGQRALVIDVELKISYDDQREALVDAVCQVIREERAGRKVMISTFDEAALVRVEEQLPGVVSGLLGVWKGGTLRAAKKLIAQGTPVEFVIPSRWAPFSQAPDAEEAELTANSYIRKVHAAGLRAGIWTVNDADDIRDYAEDGYDLVITDEPNVAREVLPPNHVLPYVD